MKRFLGYAAMFALLSAPAFAASNSGKFTLDAPVTVGTTQLPAANYKLTWTGTGDNAQVTLSNGKSNFTLPAKIVEQKNGQTSIQTKSENGTTVLKTINLNKVSVEFTSNGSSGQ